MNENDTPALTLPLTGRALIEASAGTGKTWTLTGLILRLLLEGGRKPRDIIATTFTRKAAAEMQRRVRDRLDTIRARLQHIAAACHADDSLLDDDDALAARIARLLDDAGENDPVNRHLILAPIRTHGLDGFIDTCKHVEIIRHSLAELTIGTLDSLCQRWLAENALDTGSDEHLHINPQSAVLADTIHDNLRHIRADLAHDRPADYTRLLAEIPLRDSTAYHNAVATARQYGTAAITPVPLPDNDTWQQQRAKLHTLSEADIADWQQLTGSDDFNTALNHNSNAWYKHRAALPALIACLRDDRPLSGACQKLAGLTAPKYKARYQDSELAARYHDHPLTTVLRAALASRPDSAQLDDAATAALLTRVRAQLPQALEARRETTYTDKITRLNDALAGMRGAALAHYLTHRYPVMLVDESQDLNHDQATLLKRTYLRAPVNPEGLLILVGDPKQAIYGFRGGDVANYNDLKQHFGPHEQHQLLTNHRSSQNLIAALNEHYADGDNARLGDNITYHPARAAGDPVRITDPHGARINAPLIWLESGSTSDEEAATLAQVIADLTSATSPYARRDEKSGSLYRIEPRHIQVLMRSNSSLKTLRQALDQKHIANTLQQDQNLYQGGVAHAFADLLAAILAPDDQSRLNRLLGSLYYNRTQADLDRLAAIEQGEEPAAQNELTLAALRATLNDARDNWQRCGLLAALTPILNPHRQTHSIWHTLARQPAPDNLRHLLDLRHIQQILARRSPVQRPSHYLRWWQHQLADPPEAEWATVPPLPGSNAVQLLTIHKAKGLQAPVVILAPGNLYGTGCGTITVHPVRAGGRISLSIGKNDEKSEAQRKVRENEENARLQYVGLTRAEDLLLIAKQTNSRVPAATRQLYQSQAASPHSCVQQPPYTQDSTPLPAAATAAPPMPAPLPAPWPKTRYYGWQRTSFTALIRDGIDTTPDIHLADYAITGHENTPAAADGTDDIRYTFPRGPAAGSYLHAILEHSSSRNRPHWRERLAAEAGHWQLTLDDARLDACEHWLETIHAARCPQSGITLAASKEGAHRSELAFNLAISDHDPGAQIATLNRLLADCGHPLDLRPDPRHYRYLRGEIDHTYQHGGRYYILDYKSNHLGNHAADYQPDALRRAMDDHHYWLQAAIYQVALHRLLQTRLTGYDPEKHLGGVEYLYLRGVDSHDPASGSLGWRYPTETILALDRTLGYRT